MTNCPHCNHPASGTYCSNCGEKLTVEDLSISLVLAGFFKSIFNFDKGILFVLKSMLLDPKTFCDSYLNGKRRKGLNPITFLFVSITIILILDYLFNFSDPAVTVEFNVEEGDKMAVLKKFVKDNIKYILLFMVLPLAYSAKLIFKKYNYAEHIVISSYILGFTLLISPLFVLLFQGVFYWFYIIVFYFMFRVFSPDLKNWRKLVRPLMVIFLFVFFKLVLVTSLIYSYIY